MEIAAGLLELGFVLIPALLGLGIALAVMLRKAPAERRRRVWRFLTGIAVGALVAVAGYRWMLDGAGDGWVFYAIPPTLLYAIALPVIAVVYLRAPAPGQS